jgi:alpha-galactosidase
VQPTRIGSLPPQLAGMSRLHTSVQELTVRAALEGKRDYVYHAAMLDPLVAATLPPDRIWAMVDDLIAAHGSALPKGIR